MIGCVEFHHPLHEDNGACIFLLDGLRFDDCSIEHLFWFVGSFFVFGFVFILTTIIGIESIGDNSDHDHDEHDDAGKHEQEDSPPLNIGVLVELGASDGYEYTHGHIQILYYQVLDLKSTILAIYAPMTGSDIFFEGGGVWERIFWFVGEEGWNFESVEMDFNWLNWYNLMKDNK